MTTQVPRPSMQPNNLDAKDEALRKAEELRTSASSSSSSSSDSGDRDYHDAKEQGEEASSSEQSEDASYLLVCRICFEGRDSEGEGLGKLIAPCRCRGTMKFVHTSCLKQWRLHSTRSSSAMACDQCGAAYKFRKSKFVGLASNPLLLFALSVPLFLLLIWSVGFAADLGLRWSNTSSDRLAAPQQPVQRPWWSLRGLLQDDTNNDAAYLIDGDYYYYYGYTPYAEPRGYLRLLKTSWQHVRAGGVLGALADLAAFDEHDTHGTVEVDAKEAEKLAIQEASRLQAEQKGRWSSFLWEWQYGEAGLWPGQAPAPPEQAETAKESANSLTPSVEHPNVENMPQTVSETAKLHADRPREKAGTRYAESPAAPKRTKSARLLVRVDAEAKSSWMQRIAMQFSLGISLVGIISFLNMAITLPFLHLGNFGLGRGMARMTGGTRRAARQAGNGADGSAIATALLLFLIFLGVMRALHVVFKGVRALARRALTRLEDVIVEWGAADELEEQQRLHRERTARALPRRNPWTQWLPARWLAA